MANFFKSLFNGKNNNPEENEEQSNKKKFDILKFDGLRASRMGRPDYAVKCFNEAISLEEDFETYSYLASTQIQLGLLEDACTTLNQMIKLEPELVSTYISSANVLFMLESYDSMSEAALKAIELEAENHLAHLLLAKAENGRKNELIAIAHLTKSISIKEDYIEAYHFRAEILVALKQFPEAMKDIEYVLQADENDENTLLLRGKLYEMTNEHEKALADYTTVVELNPFNEHAHLQLGQLLISTNKPDDAISSLDEAIELNPNFAEAYHERGRAKLLKGDKEGSLEDVKKAMELNPEAADKLNGKFDNFKDLYANVPLGI